MTMENGYSLADIATATGNEGMGNGSFIWIFALLLLLFGSNGGFGWGNRGDYGQFASAASQQEILFGQQFQGLDNKIDRIGNGIADATFALNNSIKDGNAAVAGRVVDEGRGLQMQLADCCCKTQQNTDALRFDMANYACAIKTNDNENTQKILDAISENKIAALTAKVNELQLSQAMCGVPRISNYGYQVVPAFGCGCTGYSNI